MPAPATRVLAVIPPMTQLNTPYPSTAYLTGFSALARHRRRAGGSGARAGAGAARAPGPGTLRAEIAARPHDAPQRRVQAFVDQFERYADGGPGDRLPAGPRRHADNCIAARGLLPEGERFAAPRRLRGRRGTAAMRSPGPSARSARTTARAISPRSTSTTWPTCCATPSTCASSSCATPSSSPPASQPELRAAGAGAGRAANQLIDRTLLRRARGDRAHRHAGAAVGALPRRDVRRAAHRADDQGAGSPSPSRWAAASSTLSCASWPSRACSTSSTSITLDGGERPLLAFIEHLEGRRSRASAWCAASCARTWRVQSGCAT